MKNKGFSLVELMVVVGIIAILSGISFGTFSNIQRSSRDTKRQSDLKVIQSSLEQYKSDQGFYPSTLSFGLPLTNYTGRPATTETLKTYLKTVPMDPQSGNTAYSFINLPDGCDNSLSASYCSSYRLCVKLENPESGSSCTDDSTRNYEVTP